MDYPKTEAGLRARIEALTTLMRNEREEREREREERKRERELLLAKLKETTDQLEATSEDTK